MNAKYCNKTEGHSSESRQYLLKNHMKDLLNNQIKEVLLQPSQKCHSKKDKSLNIEWHI